MYFLFYNLSFLFDTAGVQKVVVDIPWETTKSEIISLFREALDANPEIKIAVVDHISCCSAIMMPVADIIDICRHRGVLVVVDGAHGAGQLPLSLEDLGADFYLGETIIIIDLNAARKWAGLGGYRGMRWVLSQPHLIDHSFIILSL